MIAKLLLVAGVATLSISLRCFHHHLLHRLGTIGIFITSFLAGWLLGGTVWLGVAFAASWLFLPWLEILTRIRRLRLPAERTLKPRTPPSPHTFPNLPELTGEIESEGFEYMQDTGWEFDGYRHYYRLFLDATRREQAAVCLIEQNDFAFYYVALTSQTSGPADDPSASPKTCVTWNYPFSYGMKNPSNLLLQRIEGEIPFAELRESHQKWLAELGFGEADLRVQEPEAIDHEISRLISSQVEHNVRVGILRRDEQNLIRYSFRGMIFLWCQFLRDLIRLS
jgi:hypothetical protein